MTLNGYVPVPNMITYFTAILSRVF